MDEMKYEDLLKDLKAGMEELQAVVKVTELNDLQLMPSKSSNQGNKVNIRMREYVDDGIMGDDDVEDNLFDNLDQSWENSGVDQEVVFGTGAAQMFGRRKRKKPRKSIFDRTPEIEEKISQANYLYIQEDKMGAIKLLQEVLKENPRLYDVYDSIAEMYGELGNSVMSLKYEALAAVNYPLNSLGHKNTGGRWLEVAKKSLELGLYEQTEVATSTIIRLFDAEKFPDGFLLRAVALLYRGMLPRALTSMKLAMQRFPTHIHMYIDFASRCEDIRRYDIALQFYLRYAIYCMSASDIDADTRAHFPYFLNSQQIAALEQSHQPEHNGEVPFHELNIELFFLSIERIADICLWFQDNDLFHKDQLSTRKSTSMDQEKYHNMCKIFNEFTVVIIDAFFSYLDRIRNQTNRRSDHDALQAPMIIGFLYAIGRMRRNSDDDVNAGIRVINPLLTALSKNRQSITQDGDADMQDGGEYVENISLLKQQVRLVEEFLNHGMTTRATRLAIDLVKEHEYLVNIFTEEELSSNADKLLTLLIRIAYTLKRASELLDVDERGPTLVAASTAFALAFKLDPNMENNILTIRYSEFLLYQQQLLDAVKTATGDDKSYEEDDDDDEKEDVISSDSDSDASYRDPSESKFKPSEDLDAGFAIASQRFDVYYGQKIESYTTLQPSSLSSTTSNIQPTSNDNTDSDNDVRNEGEKDGENETVSDDTNEMKEAKEDAEMERVFGNLYDDEQPIAMKYNRRFNYSLHKKQRFAAIFDVTSSSSPVIADNTAEVEVDQDDYLPMKKHVRSIYENKFNQQDVDVEVYGMLTWIQLLQHFDNQTSTRLARILFPLLMCWIRVNDRFYSRKNHHLFILKSYNIMIPTSSEALNSTSAISSEPVTSSQPVSSSQTIAFNPSIVTSSAVECNRTRIKLSRDPRFEYAHLVEKSTVETFIYFDSAIYECSDLISWLYHDQSNADYFIYMYALNFYTFISSHIELDMFCEYGMLLLKILRKIGHKSLFKQFKAVINPYLDKLKSNNASKTSTKTVSSSSAMTSASSGEYPSLPSYALIQPRLPSSSLGPVSSLATFQYHPQSYTSYDTDIMESMHSQDVKSSASRRKKVQTISSDVADIMSNLIQSNDIPDQRTLRMANLFPDVSMNSAELSLFLRSAAEISDATKLAAIEILTHPKKLASANMLIKAVLCSRDHAIDRIYAEQSLPTNRFLTWFPDNIASKILAGNERAQARKFSEALDHYLDAFELDSSQPLTSLYIGSLLVFFAYHRLVRERTGVLSKGLLFIQHYKTTRLLHANHIREYYNQHNGVDGDKKSNGLVEEDDVIQEVYYNLGRAMADSEMNHLAVDNYIHALEVQDDYDYLHHTSSDKKILPFTRQAAHNLILIYKKSQAYGEAYHIMNKYLSL